MTDINDTFAAAAAFAAAFVDAVAGVSDTDWDQPGPRGPAHSDPRTRSPHPRPSPGRPYGPRPANSIRPSPSPGNCSGGSRAGGGDRPTSCCR